MSASETYNFETRFCLYQIPSHFIMNFKKFFLSFFYFLYLLEKKFHIKQLQNHNDKYASFCRFNLIIFFYLICVDKIVYKILLNISENIFKGAMECIVLY